MQQAMFFEASDPIVLVREQPERLVTVLRVIEREETYGLPSRQRLATVLIGCTALTRSGSPRNASILNASTWSGCTRALR